MTTGGSVLKPLASATVSHHTISVTGTLDVLGAGTTTATVWAGDSADSLAPVAGSSAVLEKTGAFTLAALVPGNPHTVYWKIVSENVTPAGSTWTSETPVYTIDTTDAATYTWKAEVTSGNWNDPANWTVSGVSDTSDVLGYPNSVNAPVVFLADTVADVTVPTGTWYFKSMDLNKNVLDLRFIGEGAAASTLYGNVWGGGDSSRWTDWTVVFDNMTLREENSIQLGGPKSENIALKFENGAVGSFSGWQELFGTNTVVSVTGGSQLVWRNTDGFTVRAAGGGLVLDDSTMTVPYVNYQRGTATAEQTFLIKGDNPRLRVTQGFRVYNESEDPMLYNLDIVYSVPRTGWTAGDNTPIFADFLMGTTANKKFGYRSSEGTGKVVLSVDPASPLCRTGRGGTVQLLEWNAGIDTTNVVLTDSANVHMYYTYGFPQVRTTPNSVDEVPTGVAADIVGRGSTTVIFQ